jgi:hypothetical protein
MYDNSWGGNIEKIGYVPAKQSKAVSEFIRKQESLYTICLGEVRNKSLFITPCAKLDCSLTKFVEMLEDKNFVSNLERNAFKNYFD